MSINLVSCLICTFWHWKFYFIPFFKSKQLPSPGYFRKLEILEVEAQIKHAGRVNPQSPHVHLDRADGSFFASPLPPTKREEGVMLWTPASDIWQCQLLPTHPFPTFSTLPIDACSSKFSDHKRIAPTHCGFNSGPLGAWQSYGSLLTPSSQLYYLA